MWITLVVVASVQLFAPQPAPAESIDRDRGTVLFALNRMLNNSVAWAAARDCSSARAAVKAVRANYPDLQLQILSVKTNGEGGYIVRVDDGRYIWDVQVYRNCDVEEV